MRQNLHKSSSFKGHGDVLERKAALVQQSYVFFQIPAKWFFHVAALGQCLPNVNCQRKIGGVFRWVMRFYLLGA